MYFVSQEMPISVLPAISNVWTKHLVSKRISFLLTPWSVISLEVVAQIIKSQINRCLCAWSGVGDTGLLSQSMKENVLLCFDILYRAVLN